MNEPAPFNPTEYLIEREHQITAPHVPGVEPLPPVRSAVRVVWDYFGRVAPGLVTTAVTLLAWGWHEQLPDGSTQPLWLGGLLTGLAGAAGVVSAAKPNGDTGTTRVAFGGAGVSTLLGIAAWTPDSALRALLWLLGTAAVYAVCAPMWRGDRREEHNQRHEMRLAEAEHRNNQALALIERDTRIGEAMVQHRTEVARTEAISQTVEALVTARTQHQTRAVASGDELNVAALLKAAGHTAPTELAAVERQGQTR